MKHVSLDTARETARLLRKSLAAHHALTLMYSHLQLKNKDCLLEQFFADCAKHEDDIAFGVSAVEAAATKRLRRVGAYP